MVNNPLLATFTNGLKRIKSKTVVAFILTLSLCMLLIFAMVLNRSKVERLTMEQLILEKSIKVQDVISKLLYKTQILSSLVVQNNGEIDSFEQIAATIIDDPAIMNILVAPDGVVSNVYPREGNEAVIGLNYFAEGAGNKEAIMAKETGRLVLGGPFESVQGGQVLVGRLPVFINGADGSKDFWGLVSVTLKYPQALDGAGLNELKIQGFAFEIWRINPDNNEKQVISDSGHSYTAKTNYIERPLSIENSDWYFRILPVRTWYEFPETWIFIFVGICISYLVASVTQNNQDLKTLKDEMELLSNTDPLTGIYNRRYFMTQAAVQMDRISRSGGEAYFILFDLDHFKNINDKFGHQSGDKALKELATRVSGILRSYDLFARYGGEEFIILASETDKESAMHLAERIRQEIAETPVKIKSGEIPITASIGVAPAAPANKLDEGITFADDALYKAKNEGRNRSVLYSQSK